MKRVFKYLSFVLLSLFLYGCRQFFGDQSLGNNFHLLEGDRVEDQVIVYSSGDYIASSGMFVLPKYSNHMKDGRYEEYVSIAKSQGGWIVAKTHTISTNSDSYWIIDTKKSVDAKIDEAANKDSILQQCILGPFTYDQFLAKMSQNKISIEL